MGLVPRWLRRDPEPDRGTPDVDDTITQVSDQVVALQRALRRIELREAAKRHGRPEPA